MENIEKNEIITNEEIENLTEATANNGSMLKTLGIIGAGAAGAVLLTKFVLIPVARKIKKAVAEKRLAKQANDTDGDDLNLDDIEVDEVPEI